MSSKDPYEACARCGTFHVNSEMREVAVRDAKDKVVNLRLCPSCRHPNLMYIQAGIKSRKARIIIPCLAALIIGFVAVGFLVSTPQVTPTVAVMTDRGFYSPGDQVTISISATGTEGSYLWLSVTKPDLHNLYYSRVTNATVIIQLPPDAPNGTYTVMVSWSHRYVETGFIVESQPIPEFPFAPIMFLFIIVIALASVSRLRPST